MRSTFWGLTVVAILFGCQDKEDLKTEYTGNETVYALLQASDYNIYGTVTLRERLDGAAFIDVELSGTEASAEHPVHLHLGDIATPSAAVAALLSPVEGSTGKSQTVLNRMADETSITYKELLALNACIKVHLSATGEARDIVLAGANIGGASAADGVNGRVGFGVCSSN